MKYLKAPLAAALAAQLLVATAQAKETVEGGEAATDAAGTEQMSMPLQTFTHVQTGLEYANQKAIEPMTEFLTDGLSWMLEGSVATSNALMNGVEGTYNSAVQMVVAVPDLPNKAGRAFFGNMRGHDFHKFLDLVYETGFALTDVEVGVHLLPSLSIYFEHEEDLTEEARAEITQKIDDYVKDPSNNAGYIEAAVLRALIRAGTYSGEIDLKGVDISILPLPGLSLTFDPVRVQQRDEIRNEKAAKNADLALEEIAVLANRLQKVEVGIFGQLEDEQSNSETQAPVTE